MCTFTAPRFSCPPCGTAVPAQLAEYAMKRMLAAGSGEHIPDHSCISRHETGRLQQCEFTLIEWYRCGYSMAALMAEVAQLAGELLALPASAPVQYLQYAAAFERELVCIPCARKDRPCAPWRSHMGSSRTWRTAAAVMNCSTAHGQRARCATGQIRSVPRAPLSASQAALARLDPEDPQLACASSSTARCGARQRL